MMAKRRKQKAVQIKFNLGKKCGTCGKRFLNPFTHVCKVKFGQVGQRRITKKKGW